MSAQSATCSDMTTSTEQRPTVRHLPRRSRAALLWLALGGVGGAAVLDFAATSAFAPYYATVSPVVGTALVVLVGVAALSYLDSRGWFAIRAAPHESGGVILPAATAAILAAPVIMVDVLGGFPRDINVEAPESILFYPVIAVVAEIAFHAVPLAVLLGVLSRAALRFGRDRLVWLCIAMAAVIEPAFQVVWAPAASPAWATAYVSLHVLIINLIGLHFLRRYDFLTGYLFRVLYYVCWHVLWGFLRLRLLLGD